MPTASIALRNMHLRELVYADDICLLATWPGDLQALIDALAAYIGMLHIEISAAKTQVMALFASGVPASSFTCNGHSIEQARTFKYLGLHFHDSGDIAHLIQPIRNWLALGRLFNGVILFYNVGALSTLICNCCSPSWCLLCVMVVRCWACTAQVQVLLGRHTWPYSRFMIFTSGSFVA